MEILSKYFWIVIICIIGANLLLFRARARNYLDNNPDLKQNSNKMYLNIFIFLSLPILVQGMGIISGSINSMFEYLEPEDLNVFIILWYASIVLMWTKGTYWIFTKNGAEFLVGHPGILLQGMFRMKITYSPKRIKIAWIVSLLFGIWGMLNPFIIGSKL